MELQVRRNMNSLNKNILALTIALIVSYSAFADDYPKAPVGPFSKSITSVDTAKVDQNKLNQYGKASEALSGKSLNMPVAPEKPESHEQVNINSPEQKAPIAPKQPDAPIAPKQPANIVSEGVKPLVAPTPLEKPSFKVQENITMPELPTAPEHTVAFPKVDIAVQAAPEAPEIINSVPAKPIRLEKNAFKAVAPVAKPTGIQSQVTSNNKALVPPSKPEQPKKPNVLKPTAPVMQAVGGQIQEIPNSKMPAPPQMPQMQVPVLTPDMQLQIHRPVMDTSIGQAPIMPPMPQMEMPPQLPMPQFSMPVQMPSMGVTAAQKTAVPIANVPTPVAEKADTEKTDAEKK